MTESSSPLSTLETTEAVLSYVVSALVPAHADWCKVHFAYRGRLELIAAVAGG